MVKLLESDISLGMARRRQPDWQWHDLQPMTRVVIGIFGRGIGERPPADLTVEEAQKAFSEAFPRANRIANPSLSGPSHLLARKTLVRAIHEAPYERIRDMTQELGRLAGATEGSLALADQVNRDVKIGNRLQAITPSLQFLSEVALQRRQH